MPLAAQVRARRKAFCFWYVFFIFEGAAKLQWAGGTGSAPFGVLTSPKRWVRAAHGRGCEQRTGADARPKPTSFFIKRLGVLWIFSKRSILLKKIHSFQV